MRPIRQETRTHDCHHDCGHPTAASLKVAANRPAAVHRYRLDMKVGKTALCPLWATFDARDRDRRAVAWLVLWILLLLPSTHKMFSQQQRTFADQSFQCRQIPLNIHRHEINETRLRCFSFRLDYHKDKKRTANNSFKSCQTYIWWPT